MTRRLNMRFVMKLCFSIALLILNGCSNATESTSASTTAPPEGPPAVAPEDATSTEQDAFDFDPLLILAWPAAPEETRRRIDAGTIHETTIYSASLSQAGPVTIFSATVHQFSKHDLQSLDSLEMLASHGASSEE